MNKIYISNAMGEVYYLKNNTVMAAPISTDGTVSFDEACRVDVWDDCDMTEAQIREKLREQKPVAEFCNRCEKAEAIYDFDGLCKECLA